MLILNRNIMKKIAIFLLVILIACTQEEYYLCTDGITQVLDPLDCPEPIPDCPVCEDNNNCTRDLCNADTDYKCEFEEMIPCDGNEKCEEGEFPWSSDCPQTCEDDDSCTVDSFNYASAICAHEEILPCCGNVNCETGETYVNCPQDCRQLVDIKISSYQKMHSMEGAYYGDLLQTDSTYLIVRFKIHNIALDRLEELNFKQLKGFYYDPFKMRLEDQDGKLYDVEYDSDLLDDWIEVDVVPKGHIIPASLLFIIPRSTETVRLIAYDNYGSKLDIDSIY